MAIRVSCPCGKFYNAPDRLAGKTVKCPGCGKPLPIPSPNEGDLLEELADLEAVAEQAELSSVSGIDRQLAASKSGTHLSSPSLKMASVKQPKAAPPVVNIVGGIIALICLILIIILLMKDTQPSKTNGARGNNISQNQNPEPMRDHEGLSHEDGATADPGIAEESEPRNNDVQPVEPDPGKDPNTNGSATSTSIPVRGGSPHQQNHRDQRTTDHPQPGTGTDPGTPESQDPDPTHTASSTTTNATAQATKPAKAKYIHDTMPKGLFAWYDSGKELMGTRRPQGTQMLELQYGWMVDLLPHLGYHAEYDKLDFQKPWRDEPNLDVVKKVIPEFLNPADNRTQYSGYMFSGLGLTHFVGMSGIDNSPTDTAARLPRSDPRAGIFGYDQIARRDQITDGTSHTIMLIGSGELAGPWAVAGGQTVRAARKPYFHRLSGFGSRGYGRDGATVLMADGSVRWVDATINPEVFKAMCTIHGGESVDLSQIPLDLP